MKVNITLYKTNFDEENPFVSTSKEKRVIDIDRDFSEDRLVMENSSFNIETPFRIAKNFFDLDKKYNYAKYEYYNGNELKDTRFYFIKNFQYVSDNVTDMVTSEDVIGEHFWDLSIKTALPSSYTYKNEYIKDLFYKTVSNNNVFIQKREINNLVENYGLVLGFVVVSATLNNAKYIENNTEYNLQTFIIPFLCKKEIDLDTSDGSILDVALVSKDKSKEEIVINYYLSYGINDFNLISKITELGFSIVSTLITFDIDDIVESFDKDESFGTNGYLIKYKNNVTLSAFKFTEQTVEKSFVCIDNYTPLERYFDIEFDEYSLPQYKKITLSLDNKTFDIDLTSVNRHTEGLNEPFRIWYKKTLVPPYSTNFYFNSKKVPKNYINIKQDSNFMWINDTYSDWLKANKNSEIMGLEVQRQYGYANAQNLAIKTTVYDAVKMPITGYGETQVALGLNLWAKSLFDNRYLTVQHDWNMWKQEQMLNLKIQDLMNTPDSCVFGNSITNYWNNKNYLRIIYYENIVYEEIKKTHKMYGFTNQKRINTIRSHSIFDYIQATDITFTYENQYNPTVAEIKNIEQYFANGIRVWYSTESYKGFDTPNEEV